MADAMAPPSPPTVPRVSLRACGPRAARRNFVARNLPVLLTDAGVEGWRAWAEWRAGARDGGEGKAETGGVDFARFNTLFGSVEAPVVNCKSGMRFTLPVAEFLSAWESGGSSSSPPLRYMKDWHLVRDFPNYAAYTTPAPFARDWLNDWWTLPDGRARWAAAAGVAHSSNDYRFCYLGCKGTWTPVHHDVMYSFSWSANVVGRKLWRLFPPVETPKLYHRRCRDQLVADSRDGEYDPADYPNVAGAVHVDVVQRPGEVMFVPSGWHHQVHNLDDCISVNHNWLNAQNIGLVWRFVEDRWAATRSVISHLEAGMPADEFAHQVAVIMRADIGLTCAEFVAMLEFWQARVLTRTEREAAALDDAAAAGSAAAAAEDLAEDMAQLKSVVRAVNVAWPLNPCADLLPDMRNMNDTIIGTVNHSHPTVPVSGSSFSDQTPRTGRYGTVTYHIYVQLQPHDTYCNDVHRYIHSTYSTCTLVLW